MNQLVRYDAARNALAECARVDEAKDIRDKALALAAYARQAQDMDMIRWATEIQRRAERKTGELLDEEKLNGGDRKSLSSNARVKLGDLGISYDQSSDWQKLADIPEAEFEDAMAQPEIPSVGAIINRTSFTGNNEWFTPVEHIERARHVLGAIDLDPASHSVAQKTVRAAQWFSSEQDGLAQEWSGRVWLNPPYAQPLISHFIDKLIDEVQRSRVTAAILLTHNYTDTAWFHKAALASSRICFTRGRIRFVALDGSIAAPTQGQAFFYFGGEVELFSNSFSEVGLVVSSN
jgi:phage N-6-adenine-methyltransferase